MAAGISTDPSPGFMGRMRTAMPGMVNSLATQYGDPRLRGMNQATGQAMASGTGAFRRRTPPTNAGVQGMQTTVQNGPGGMPPTGAPTTGGSAGMVMPAEGGMVRGPSMPRVIGGDFTLPGGVMGPGGMFPRNGNTGITGGMFGMGGAPVLRPQVMPPMAMADNAGGPGLWQAYNNLSQEQGVPRSRQLFY